MWSLAVWVHPLLTWREAISCGHCHAHSSCCPWPLEHGTCTLTDVCLHLPACVQATALLRLVAGRLLAAMARDAHATDTHEARVVTELHRLATHRRQLQEGHHQQQHHHQPQQEAQEQAQAGTHGGLPAAAGSSGGAADAASIKGLYFALEVCDTRTERWGDEGRQRLAEVHAAVDYWGAMGITAGVSEWELFGPPLGSRGLAGQVQLGGAGEEAAEHAGEGGAGGSGGSRVGALAVPSLLEERMEAKRAWRRTFDVELEQRIQVHGACHLYKYQFIADCGT